MIQVGRLCLKIAGRDAGKKCVVVDIVSSTMVIIDGQTRRRKCNLKHIEPLKQIIDIKKGASHDIVAKEFKKLNMGVLETKPKKRSEKPKQSRKIKEKHISSEKPAKQEKPEKKEEKPKKAESKKEAKSKTSAKKK